MAEYIPYQPPTTASNTPAPDTSPSFFGWHPSMPNLGGFKALGQLASGIASLPEIAYSALPGGPKSMLPQLASGIVGGLGGVASTLTAPLGIPGKWNVGENLIEPAVNKLDQAIAGPQAPPVQDFFQMTKHNGVLYGALNTVLNALPVTGPLAGVAGGAADVADAAATAAGGAAAEGAATGAESAASAMSAAATKAELLGEGKIPHPFVQAGATKALDQLGNIEQGLDPTAYASRVQEIADSLRAREAIMHGIAHPFGAVAKGFAEQTAASFRKLNPYETTMPEPPPGAADLIPQAEKDAATATQQHEDFMAGNLYDHEAAAARSAARSLQAPERAAAEVISQEPREATGRLKTVTTLENGEASPVDAAGRAVQRAELTDAENAARDAVEVKGTGEGSTIDQVQQRIVRPASAWAERLADRLPDSINSVLAHMNSSVDKFRINQVARSLESWVEVAQRQVQQSAAVQESVAAGAALMAALPELKITQLQASQIIGEELNAVMRGNQWVGDFLKSGGKPELVEAMRDAARGHYKGLTPYFGRLPEDVRTQIMGHIGTAVEEWTKMMQERMQTLLASRPGAQGLEAAVLGLDQPPMTTGQVKEYRRAKMLQRLKAKLEARVPNEREAQGVDIARAELSTQKLHDEAQALRDREGVMERNMQDLRTAPPRALEPQRLEQISAEAHDAVASGQGLTIDPGTGEVIDYSDAAHANHHVVVGIALQGKYTVQDFLANTSDIIREHIENPVNTQGSTLPDGIWGGNVKLGFFVSPEDGKVAIDISVDSHYDGTPLSVLEGDVLGTAYAQEATFDLRTFEDRAMPQSPELQNLFAHYIGDVFNRKSNFSTFVDELSKTTEGGARLNEDDAFAAVTTYAMWDYSLARSNPEQWSLGDFFKVARFDMHVRGNRYIPDAAQRLGQTVMHMLPGSEVGAVESMSAESLSTALAWYYDSHEYIEGTWRYNPDGSVKMVTLLNGEQRPAAEVFYDLLAVTSVQADPTTNFGRAVTGLANLDEFTGRNVKGMTAAKALMERLEKSDNNMLSVVAPGTPEEHLAGPGEQGTKLSERFVNFPEVRALTEGTQMTNSPRYNVFSILSGDLKIGSATAGDLTHNAEWWGTTKNLSDDSMMRGQVVKELDRQGATGPVVDAYRQWAGERDRVVQMQEQIRDAAKDKGVTQTQAFKDLGITEWKTKSAFDAYRKSVLADEGAFHDDPTIAAAHDQALMEHQGSSALAKLRSFRSNLSDPHASLAVTLDSVMGRLWGFNSQQWDKTGFYAQYADRLRSIASDLSTKWGREVKPHEVQAALWVYAKQEIGRQDWGRLLAHHDNAMNQLDFYQKMLDQGKVIPADAAHGLLDDYRQEEIGYSQQALETRGNRSYFKAAAKRGMLDEEGAQAQAADAADVKRYKLLNSRVARGKITPDDAGWAEYEALREKVGEGRKSTIVTTPDRESVGNVGDPSQAVETRYEIPYDANKLRMQDERFANYAEVETKIQAALDKGDVGGARKLLTQWVVSQKNGVAGFVEGGAFGPVAEGQLIKGERGVNANATFTAVNRLKGSSFEPNDMSGTRFRTEGEQYLGQHAPAEPGMTRIYRGSDHPEVNETGALPTQGDWWSVKEPHGRGGYAHWQETMLPTHMVQDLLARAREDGNTLADGSMPVVGKDLLLDRANPVHARALDEAASYAHDAIDRPTMAEIHQQFEQELRGSLMDHPTKDGHLIMRMFKGASLDTLLHEGAHLLRRILPSDQLAELEKAYPGITAEDVSAGFGELSDNPVRVAAEEKFVADLMSWIRSKVHYQLDEASGSITAMSDDPMHGYTFARNANAEAAFGKIAAALEDQFLGSAGSPVGAQGFDINAFWTRLFYPEVDRPDVMTDPLADAAPSMPQNNTKKFPYETDAQFANRARMYGEARVRYQATSKLADQAERRAAQSERYVAKMHALLTAPTKSELLAAKVGKQAEAILNKLADDIGSEPDVSKVPAQWRPMWAAIVEMKEQAAADPTGQLAAIMEEVPTTFHALLSKWAETHNEPPVFTPDMTWEQANRGLFNHIRLGVERTAVDSTRKENEGVLHRAGIANQSIEQLGAATVAATKELYSNTLIDHIEKYYAKPVAPGADIPKGWVPWSPERSYIVTGTRPTGEIAQTGGASLIVPKHVQLVLDNMSKTYDHWTFHTLTRANSVWRTYQLTLSPRYYVHLVVANMVRAIADGASPEDFKNAWTKVRNKAVEPELIGLDQETAYHTLVNENVPEKQMPSVFDHAPLKERLAGADGNVETVKEAVRSVRQTIDKAHAQLDQFSRSVVMEHALRSGASRDAALARSLQAFGDYGALSPFERAIVRSVMPFYPYYKGLVKLLARFPADHPGAALLLAQAATVHKEYMQDLIGGPVPDTLLNTYNIFGFHNYSILNPFTNAVQAISPKGWPTSLSPFVKPLLMVAFGGAQKGAMTKQLGPTGKLEAQYDPLKGLTQQLESGPPFVGLQGGLGLTPAAGVLGQPGGAAASPGLQGVLQKYSGFPKNQDAVVSQVQQTEAPTPAQTAAKKTASKAKAAATRKRNEVIHPKAIKPPKGGWGKATKQRVVRVGRRHRRLGT